MRKLTFEVLRTDDLDSLEAFMVRYEENGIVREFIVPEHDHELLDAEMLLMKRLRKLLETSM